MQINYNIVSGVCKVLFNREECNWSVPCNKERYQIIRLGFCLKKFIRLI